MESNEYKMKLTDRDVENMTYIQEQFDLEKGVYAISRALEISRQLIEMEASGNKILLEKAEGKLQEITLT